MNALWASIIAIYLSGLGIVYLLEKKQKGLRRLIKAAAWPGVVLAYAATTLLIFCILGAIALYWVIVGDPKYTKE